MEEMTYLYVEACEQGLESLTADVSGIVKVDIVKQERTISEVTRFREGGDAQLHGGLHDQLQPHGTNVQ